MKGSFTVRLVSRYSGDGMWFEEESEKADVMFGLCASFYRSLKTWCHNAFCRTAPRSSAHTYALIIETQT